MVYFPEESKALPPPGIVNRTSVWLAGVGWASAILDNALRNKPAVRSGVHRQFLMATVGWVAGYYFTKHANYVYAKRDRDMTQYMKIHQEDFVPKEKKTFAEIVEPFYPVR